MDITMEYFYNLEDKLFKPKFLHKYININLAVLILKKIYFDAQHHDVVCCHSNYQLSKLRT